MSSGYGDHVRWHNFVDSGVVENWDGALMKSFEIRGTDLALSTLDDRIQRSERLGAVFKSYGRRWSWLVDSRNMERSEYELATWPTTASDLFDTERARMLSSSGAQYEMQHVLTLSQAAPARLGAAMVTMLTQNAEEVARIEQRKEFIRLAGEFATLLSGIVSVREMSDDDMASYLKSTVSTRYQRVRALEHENLSDSLPDETFQRGLGVSRLGKKAIAFCTLGGFPKESYPQMLSALSHLPFEFRVACRWLGMERMQAKKLMAKREEKALGQAEFTKDTILKMIEAKFSRKPAEPKVGYQRYDRDAVQMADQAGSAMTRLDARGFGHMTTTFIVWDSNPRRCLENQSKLTDVLRSLQFTVREERFEPMRVWLMSIPGNRDMGRRTFPVSTRNVADVLPTSSTWMGSAYDERLAKTTGVKRAWFRTADPVPYAGTTDVPGGAAHTLLFGRTGGAAKSTFANLLGYQFLGWPNAQIVSLSVGCSEIGPVLLNGGAVYSFGGNKSKQFQPLAFIDEREELVLALGWLQQCLEAVGDPVTPANREALEMALRLMAADHQKRRTMTALVKDLRSRSPHLALALKPYTNEGAYGYIFDGDDAAALERKRWTMFDIGPLLKLPDEAKNPAIKHLRHRISRWYDGKHPTLEIWDECPVTFSHPSLMNDAISVVDTQRKNDVRALLIAQTPGQLAKFPDLMKSIKSGCVTTIFGPDSKALNQASEYAEFGVNEVELREIRSMKLGSYMLKNEKGVRKFDMKLGPIQLALAGMTDSAEQALLADMHERCSDTDEMLHELLKFKGLDARAKELMAWKSKLQSEALAAE